MNRDKLSALPEPGTTTTYFNPPIVVTVSELRLRDVVRSTKNPFGTAVVNRICDDYVQLWRPYAVTEDFEMSGGQVIAYIGVEEFRVERTSPVTYELMERGPKAR